MAFTPISTSLVRLKLHLVFLAAITFLIIPNEVKADDYSVKIYQCKQTWDCDYSPKIPCCVQYCALTSCNETMPIDSAITLCSSLANVYSECMKDNNPFTYDVSDVSEYRPGKPQYHNEQINVNNTQWMVEGAANGRNGDYHRVPWTFSSDGTVRAGNLWRGVWQAKSSDTISVVIMHNNKAIDAFDVKFFSPSEFTAFKNGRSYRYGVRK